MPVCVGARAVGGPWGGDFCFVLNGAGRAHASVSHSEGGGQGAFGRGTPFVVLLRAVVGACGGLCVPGAPGLSRGAWVPYPRLLRESMGRVTCSFLSPTTEPQRVHGVCGLRCSLIDLEGHRQRCTECQTGWERPNRRKVLGRAEHFRASGAL